MRGIERQSDAYGIVSGLEPHVAAELPTDEEMHALGLNRSGPSIQAGTLDHRQNGRGRRPSPTDEDH